MGLLLSVPAGASKRETPTSKLTESTALKQKQIINLYSLVGVANVTLKNVGLGKFWQDFEIVFDKSQSLVFAWFDCYFS